jgi:predicted ATPase
VRYHDMSRGESFLELVAHHERYTGLWCLDEPEAALSFSSVLVQNWRSYLAEPGRYLRHVLET